MRYKPRILTTDRTSSVDVDSAARRTWFVRLQAILFKGGRGGHVGRAVKISLDVEKEEEVAMAGARLHALGRMVNVNESVGKKEATRRRRMARAAIAVEETDMVVVVRLTRALEHIAISGRKENGV